MSHSYQYSHSVRRPLYRSRSGMVFGVFRGLANYSGLSAFWLRVIAVGIAILSGVGLFLLPLAYVIAAIIMTPEPVLEPETEDDLEFYHSYANSRSMALARLKRRFEQLERRTRRMENVVTDKEFDWERRLARQ